MKTNFHHKSKSRSERSSRRLFVFGLIVALLSIASGFFMPNAIGYMAHSFGLPIWRGFDLIADNVTETLVYFQSKKSLKNENQALKEKINEISTKLLDYDEASRELEDLKNNLGFFDKKQFVMAYVLHSPGISAPYDSVILDIGLNNAYSMNAGSATLVGNQVKIGDQVTLYGVVPIGTVEVVYGSTAVAKLYSNPGDEMEVTVEGTDIHTKAKGVGNGVFEVVVPKELEVATSTKIIIPGPERYVLGIVEAIESASSKAQNTLYVRSPINLNHLKYVFIKSL